MSAWERWNESPYGPYGDGISEPALPEYRPSVLRDLRFASSDLTSRIFQRGWSHRLNALVLLWFGGLAIGAFKFSYWAQWEKLAWYWTRTDAQEQLRQTGTTRPPHFHRVLAFAVGLFWGALGMFVTVVLWAFVAWLARLT